MGEINPLKAATKTSMLDLTQSDSSLNIYSIQKITKTEEVQSKDYMYQQGIELQNNNSASASEMLSAALKEEYGAKVVAMSDSNGCIYDENGINLDIIKKIKEVERKRIKE